MNAVPYKTRNGEQMYMPQLPDDSTVETMHGGWCLVCGQEVDHVEPDVRQQPCEVCGRKTVYGIEELFFMGMVAWANGEPVQH